MWDQAEADGRVKRGHWRPWHDGRNNPFGNGRPPRPRSEILKEREELKRAFHIND